VAYFRIISQKSVRGYWVISVSLLQQRSSETITFHIAILF